MSTATMSATGYAIKEKRSVGMGIFFLVVALAIFGFFALNSGPEMTSTFGLNPGSKTNAPKLDDWTLPTQTTLWALAIITAFMGGWQLAKDLNGLIWPC